MRLSSNATTPQELREEIVSLLLHRAKSHRELSTLTRSITLKEREERVAQVLGNIASEITCMELTNASPAAMLDSGLRMV